MWYWLDMAKNHAGMLEAIKSSDIVTQGTPDFDPHWIFQVARCTSADLSTSLRISPAGSDDHPSKPKPGLPGTRQTPAKRLKSNLLVSTLRARDQG
jgi:hypothetical protein